MLPALGPSMRSVIQDLRYAFRSIRRSPGFFAVALLTLGIGTGANATVFSFVNALLLRPVPGVAEPASLVSIYTSDYSSGPYGLTSFPDYLTLKADADIFAGLATYAEEAALIRVGTVVERVRRMSVSPEFFDVLGMRAASGRLLNRIDFNHGSPGVVIAHGFWRRAFDADPAAVGRTIVIDDAPYTIVGVAPSEFAGLSIFSFDLWVPLDESISPKSGRGDRNFSVIGRLRAATDLESANAQVAAIAARLARDHPETNRGTLQQPQAPRPMTVVRHARIQPAFSRQVTALSGVLLGAVLLVLLIACANVTSLLLARATARRREVAIRLALGASRWRVAQQMLTESALLGAAGCVAGVLVALWTADVLLSFFPTEQARLLDAAVDIRVFSYTAAISAFSAMFFGMAPAMQAFRTPSTASLRASAGAAAARGGGRLRRSLIAAQIALATVLLVSAGLLVKTLVNTFSADLGFETRGALLASVALPAVSDREATLAYFESALNRVRALPGVEAATLTTALPLARTSRRGFRIEGYEPRPGEDREFPFVVVEPSYFQTMRIEVLEGRTFEGRDDRRGAPVAMVNALFAARYFGGRAVGKRLTDSQGTALEVIGVVRTGKYRTVQESVPTVYYPFAQAPRTVISLVVRSTGDPTPLTAPVRAAMTADRADAAIYNVRTLDAHIAEALGGERLIASLVSICGGLALLLAFVGVYGVVSYAVGMRTREIGVRVALGAAPSAIVRLVLDEGGRVLAAGLLVGLAAAAVTARLLSSMLYGVMPLDASTFAAVVAALALATIAAAAVPARRALAVDPMTALREN